LFIVLIILTTGIVFADLQFEMALGYHFTTNTFDTLSRSFNGFNFSATNRVFLTERIGWFVGSDSRFWFGADNNDFLKHFDLDAISWTIDNSTALHQDLTAGIALAFPLNERFGLQSDLGMSFMLFSMERISGDIIIMPYHMKYIINTDWFFSPGIYFNIFGRYLLAIWSNELSGRVTRGYLTFGTRMNYKFLREERGIINIGGDITNFSNKVNSFSGFSIAAYLGFVVNVTPTGRWYKILRREI